MIQMGDASADEEGKDITKEYLEEHQEKFPSGEFKEVPPWRKHITVMGIVTSFVIGSLYSLVIIEAEPHHWTGSQPQCLSCACRIYYYSIMDKATLEVWDFIDSVYSTGEYAQSDSANIECVKHGYADGSKGDGVTNCHVPMFLDMANSSSTLQRVNIGHEQMVLGDTLMVNRAGKNGATHNRWKSMDGSLRVSKKQDQMEFILPKRSKGPTVNVDELMLTDPEKAKRIMANRRSAMKAVEKRLRYVAELEKEERELNAETMKLELKIAFIKKEAEDEEVLSEELKLAMETMEEKVKFQDETNAALMEERQRLMTIVAAQRNMTKVHLSARTNQIVSPGAYAMAPVVPLQPQTPPQPNGEDTGNPAALPNRFGGNAYGNPPGAPPSM
ncbi:hypothetical protein Sjap_006019 [Stephania japonica]|uniref:BZIP domain-containing protein n=1 Tax=Stephania japonica TaxID=461633 RepID=A0AAP0K513_9MAGN